MNSDPGMGTYPPQGALALCTILSQSAIGQLGWGFHTVRGGSDPRDHRSRPQVVRVVKVWIYNPGMGTYPPRGALALCTIPSQSAIGQLGWGRHTVRGGIDPRDHRFRPRVVGVVDIWNVF